jgi:hypothetical protein
MGSIQVPALQIQPPNDPLEQLSRLAQLKAYLQQTQYQQQMQPLQLEQQRNQLTLQQQQIKDQQAGQAAYSQWDGKDYQDLAKLIIHNGGSVSSAQQVAAFGLTQLEKHSNIIKNEADAGFLKVQTQQKNNDKAAGAFDALNGLSDDQLPQAFGQTLQQGLRDGWIDQQHAQLGQQIAQQPAAQIRAALPFITKSYQAESAQQEAALKQAQAAKAQAETPGAAAESQLKQAQQQAYAQWATLPGNQNKNYNDFLAEQGAVKAGAEARARLPYEMQLASFNRQTAMGNVLAEHAMNSVTGLFTDPQHGYSQTLSQLSATKNAIANAQNGDQLAASMAPLMTALGVTSFAGLHRINQNEINAAGPQVGSVLRQIDSRLSKLGSGKLAGGTASEMLGLMDNLLDAKYSTVVQSARMAAANGGIDPRRVTVMDKTGNLVRLSDAAQGSGGGAGAAAGYTRIKASDGSIHDVPTGNLGAARKIDPGLQVVE